ncbi:tetratricopeptide repeat protein [Pontivivens nitratireducens]|uniref:tetratricopeptide repeat protein n=1 Tax=Pontivivens nitratireducens TaxID=2758038 RepID=UPI001639E1C2
MSNTDSFIDEVSEEVRRDQLYTYARRYGWIAVVVVLGIVGGAAYNEYREASTRTSAESFGLALDQARLQSDPQQRAEAFDAIEADGDAAALAAFARAQALVEAGEPVQASALLDDLRNAPDLPPLYTALATLKWAVVPGALPPVEARIDALSAVIDEGSQMSLLALEQRGLAHVEAGNIKSAHDDFRFILGDPLATAALRDRVTQMIIATGGTPGAAELTTPQGQIDGN